MHSDAAGREIFGLIERSTESGALIGKIIGFPHVELSGADSGQIAEKLRSYVQQLQASGALVLESQFVQLVRLGVIEDCRDSSSRSRQP